MATKNAKNTKNMKMFVVGVVERGGFMRLVRMRGWRGLLAGLVLVLAGCQPVQPSTVTVTPAADVSAAAPMAGVASIYTEAQGRFSAPVPTNWTVTEKDGYVLLADPEASLKVYLAVVASAAISETIAATWQRVDPGFAPVLRETLDVPSAAGVEKSLIVNYDTGDDNRLVQGFGQVKDGVTYVNLYDVQMAGLQKRQAQLGIVSSGFKILAIEETDLSQTQPLTVTEAIVPPLEAFITANMASLQVPGAAVGIVQDGELVYAKGFGVANPETGAPVTPDTQMMIGSTSKSLTTLLMGILVDEGLMSWDTPVVDLYPSFAVKDAALTQVITMRNLVCACTGVPRKDLEWIFNADSMQAKDIVASLADFEFFTDFGEAFQYSNQMVATAGYVAGALAAGDRDGSGDLATEYTKALQARVLDPIGMRDTTLSFDAVEQRGDYATPHTLMLDNTYAPMSLDLERPLSLLGPAGGTWSTVNDMARYMLTQLGEGVAPDGTRVVSAQNLDVTREPQIAIADKTSYGLGWMVTDYKGQPVITHAGNTMGYTSEFTFLPDANLGVIVLTNARASNLFNGGVSSRLLELVFAQEPEIQKNIDFYLELVDQRVAEFKQQLGDEIDAEAVAPYVDAFTNDVLGAITLSLTDGVLTIDVGEYTSELWPYRDKDGKLQGYIQTDPPAQGLIFKFEKDADGQPIVVLGEAEETYTFRLEP